MSKIDTKLVAEALANVEEQIEMLPDPDGLSASTLRIVVDAIGGVIKRDHPRFNTGTFQVESLPIQTERLRRAITETLAKEGRA